MIAAGTRRIYLALSANPVTGMSRNTRKTMDHGTDENACGVEKRQHVFLLVNQFRAG